MNKVVYNVSLDVYKVGSQQVLSMVRGDTNRELIISLTENDRPYEIGAGCTAKFTALKSDGQFIYNNCEIDLERNTIVYEITGQTIAKEGNVSCQVRLIGTDGNIISTPSFNIVVADLLYNEQPIVESSNEFNALTNFLADLQRKLEDGEFDGKSIYIKGSVGNVSELDVKIPTAVAGDGYLADDTHLYVFDGNIFVDMGEVRGPQGISGVYVGSGELPDGYNVQIDPDGEVYEMDKELNAKSENPVSNAAITQAITAIQETLNNHETAFAPAGFGLGTTQPEKVITDPAEMDNVKQTGWYLVDLREYNQNGNEWSIAGETFVWAVLHVVSYENGSGLQFGYQELYTQPEFSIRKLSRSYGYTNRFSEWEFENPPMIVGKEYRTTERYNGEIVYTLAIEITMPNNTTIEKELEINGTISRLLEIRGTTSTGYDSAALRYDIFQTGEDVKVWLEGKNLYISASSDMSYRYAVIILKYTKE